MEINNNVDEIKENARSVDDKRLKRYEEMTRDESMKKGNAKGWVRLVT